jgi:Asp-tRNA(Asn)/Glu-tRNA(Gln) amidotransferase A subunit family amidase
MTLPFNIASRCPVLAIPSGLSASGMPTSISVVGRTYDDVSVFRVAAAHADQFPMLSWHGTGGDNLSPPALGMD